MYLVEAVNIFFLLMESVEAAFVRDKKIDHEACGQSYREAGYIDNCIQRILTDVAQGDSDVVLNHGKGDYRRYLVSGDWLPES